jgi:hypothetical protein
MGVDFSPTNKFVSYGIGTEYEELRMNGIEETHSFSYG